MAASDAPATPPSVSPQLRGAEAGTPPTQPSCAAHVENESKSPPDDHVAERISRWPLVSLVLNVIAATVAVVMGMQHTMRDSATDGVPHSCDTYECLVERLANANLEGLLCRRFYTVIGWGAALVS
eukprot:5773328-Pleurochrysis_carterae.AAC.1